MIGLADTKNEQIKDFFLIAAYPNPFNSQPRISFETGKKGHYSIKIIDILEREVDAIFSGELTEGKNNFIWDGKNKYDIPAAA